MTSNVTPLKLEWDKSGCAYGSNGTLTKNLANACHFLRHHPEIRGRFAFDEFSLSVIVRKPLPWSDETDRDWTDLDDLCAAELAQSQPNDFNIDPRTIASAVQRVAAENAYHPVRAYLNSLNWDGEPRLEKWLSYYLGAEQGPYSAAIGRAWPVSAVARIMQPGCKADHVLILEGPQGLKKSSALKALAGEQWFTDEIADFGSKDAAMQVRGVWVIELAELDQLSKRELTTVKAFVTRTTDRFRPPYGARMITSPRECVFAGTTNEDAYLRDPTGARRYWPVKCGPHIDLDGIRADRDQLWAEAVHRYRNGEPWWLIDREIEQAARDAQRERYEEDPWQTAIMEWIAERPDRDHFRMDELLVNGLGLSSRDLDQRAQKRVANILHSNGWQRRVVRVDGGKRTTRAWVRKDGP